MACSESINFITKSKAIALPFSQKMAGYKSIDFLPNGKATGLPFSQKNG